MADHETAANVVPLNPAPAKSKSRARPGKRTRATLSRRRRSSPLPAATTETAAATDAIPRFDPVIHFAARAAAPPRVLAVAVFALGLMAAAAKPAWCWRWSAS
jgi:hypothetical protein